MVTKCQRTSILGKNRCNRRSFSFFFSSRRRHTRWPRDWSSDVCSSDLSGGRQGAANAELCISCRTPNGRRPNPSTCPCLRDEWHVVKELSDPCVDMGNQIASMGKCRSDRKSVVEGKSVEQRGMDKINAD